MISRIKKKFHVYERRKPFLVGFVLMLVASAIGGSAGLKGQIEPGAFAILTGAVGATVLGYIGLVFNRESKHKESRQERCKEIEGAFIECMKSYEALMTEFLLKKSDMKRDVDRLKEIKQKKHEAYGSLEELKRKAEEFVGKDKEGDPMSNGVMEEALRDSTFSDNAKNVMSYYTEETGKYSEEHDELSRRVWSFREHALSRYSEVSEDVTVFIYYCDVTLESFKDMQEEVEKIKSLMTKMVGYMSDAYDVSVRYKDDLSYIDGDPFHDYLSLSNELRRCLIRRSSKEFLSLEKTSVSFDGFFRRGVYVVACMVIFTLSYSQVKGGVSQENSNDKNDCYEVG